MSKYKIWDGNQQVPAYIRRPKNPRAIKLTCRTVEEAKIGLRWYVPYKSNEHLI